MVWKGQKFYNFLSVVRHKRLPKLLWRGRVGREASSTNLKTNNTTTTTSTGPMRLQFVFFFGSVDGGKGWGKDIQYMTKKLEKEKRISERAMDKKKNNKTY